jgi:hypothetical protein
MTARLTRLVVVPALVAAITIHPALPAQGAAPSGIAPLGIAPLGIAPLGIAQTAAVAGACPGADGVTVVVDFQELGGSTIVRCATGPQSTGLAALKDAGITITGTTRWGEAFICRIEGKPGADTESCIDTPPASAYWSYWHASNGGSWTYSQLGAAARTPPPGSFEGWSFALDRSATGAPPPRLTPLRQAPPPPRQEEDPPADASGGGPPAGGTNPDGGGSGPGGGGTGPEAGGAGRPPDDPRTTATPTPSATPAATATAPGLAGTGDPSGQPAPTPSNLDGAAPRSSSSGPVGTLVGLGLLLALAVAGALTAWRRRLAASD